MIVTVSVNTDVDIELSEIDTCDLIEELSERRSNCTNLDYEEIKRLACRVETALAFNNGVDVSQALREYFDKVHGIRFTEKL